MKMTSAVAKASIAIACFAFVLRLLFFQLYLKDNPCQLMYDAGHYHVLAVAISQGKGFTTVDEKPQFYRLPGYPLFLALGYYLFDGDVTTTLLLQLLLSSLIPVLVYLLALLLFPSLPRGALFAGVLAALHPGLLIFSGLVMSETLFVFTFLVFLLLFFLSCKKNCNKFWILSSGIVLGFASLIRPIGVPLLGTVIVLIAVMAWWEKGGFQVSKKIALLCIGWVSVISLWLVRNWWLTGYIFFHTLPGVHFLNHMATRLIMVKEHSSYQQAKDVVGHVLKERIILKENKERRPLQEIEHCKVAEQLSVEIMLSNKLLTLKHAVSNMVKTMFSLYSSELLVIDARGKLPDYSPSRSIKEMLYRFVFPDVLSTWIIWFIYYELLFSLVVLLGFLGFGATFLVTSLKGRESGLPFYCIFSSILFYGLFVGLSFACGFARLRLPIEPFLIIVASMFWRHCSSLYCRLLRCSKKLLFFRERRESE